MGSVEQPHRAKRIDALGLRFSPLSRAEHRHGGREKRVDLFERNDFPRAPSEMAARRMKRDAGVFFWFVFFHVEENEQI